MDDDSIECTFCQKFDQELFHTLHPIFDKIIWDNNDFVIVPARGSLVEGYLLIFPRKHYHSLAHLPPNLLSSLCKIKSATRKMLTTHFTSPIFFEHGTVCRTKRAGSSIVHAHLHCVPFEKDLVPRLLLLHRYKTIDKFEDIAKQLEKHQSYIYFESQNQEKFRLLN